MIASLSIDSDLFDFETKKFRDYIMNSNLIKNYAWIDSFWMLTKCGKCVWCKRKRDFKLETLAFNGKWLFPILWDKVNCSLPFFEKFRE